MGGQKTYIETNLEPLPFPSRLKRCVFQKDQKIVMIRWFEEIKYVYTTYLGPNESSLILHLK